MDLRTEKRYTTMWKPETTFSRFWIVRENWERKLNANDVVDLLNELHDENEQLKSDLIDHSALISMLEDYQALKIEDTLYNLTGAKSEEEFNELYKPYLDKAKRC